MHNLTKQYALYPVITKQPYIISRTFCSRTQGYYFRRVCYTNS